MTNEMTNDENQLPSPAHQASASPLNGVVPPVEHRFRPGQSGNPKGRPSAGASIREHVNDLARRDLTENEIRVIARDPESAWPLRAAAERIIRAMEFGDLADFEGLLQGKETLEDLRARGVGTEVIKKVKSRSRTVSGPAGDEEIIEREIELHDRAGADFDRIVNQTAGNPMQPIEADVKTEVHGEVSEVQVLKVLDILAKTRVRDLPPITDAGASENAA